MPAGGATDCCGGVYFGGIASDDGAGAVVLSESQVSPQPGGALCVLNGTNAGDCRRLAAGGDGATAIALDRPFAAPLDDSSIVTVIPFQGHIMWVGNYYSDGGEVQLYGQALGCVSESPS